MCDYTQKSLETSQQTEHRAQEDVSSPGENESSLFFFETDHVALKNNNDYQTLLASIIKLEAQRVQAVKDLDVLHARKKQALTDPILFVHQLQQGVDPKLPVPLGIPQLPCIQWETYTSSLPALSSWQKPAATLTRQKVSDLCGGVQVKQEHPLENQNNSDLESIVRGRAPINIKEEASETFNKLWTHEEQKRLEELLIEYPPEAVEMRRWEKIAQTLGNRTPHQVQSRTQKYFIKLAKMGLPIPGRTPHSAQFPSRRVQHKHQRHNRLLFSASTFLSSIEPPVYMSDEDEDAYMSSGQYHGEVQYVSDEEDVPLELRNTPQYQKIMQLKKMKRERYRGSNMPHIGYKCDRCGCEPIIGCRWHCKDCPQPMSFDMCDDCVDFECQTSHHLSWHHMDLIKQNELPCATDPDLSTANQDDDYASSQGNTSICDLNGSERSKSDQDYGLTNFTPGSYNYLDPNYRPASS